MRALTKPSRIQAGDKIAAVTLSAGLAGAIPYRYEIGKQQMEAEFGVQLVAMKHTLKSPEWIKNNPQARADDLMEAFANPEIKGIVSTIGGEDSIRLLPHIDYSVIAANPKVFLGYSDTTVSHLVCAHAGLTSFYGPSILANFAENQGMFPYMVDHLRKAVFKTDPVGEVPQADAWTAEYLDWFKPENQATKRTLVAPFGRQVQGGKTVSGHLMGGCVQVLSMLNGTEIWPDSSQWEGSIVFMEVSESNLPQSNFKGFLRSMGAQGIWNKASGIIFARAGGRRTDEERLAFDQTLLEIVSGEYGRHDLPIMTQMDFGHTDPVFTIPYGVKAEIDCSRKKFSILEPGVS